MGKHVWEWDKKSHKPMMVVCVRCGQRAPLSEVIDEIGCDGCPVEGVQEDLFGNENPRQNRGAGEKSISGL